MPVWYDWLIAQLERRALAGAADVWLRSGTDGDELVFAFSTDQALNAAIKRLPGRRFDFRDRTWVVPAVPSLAAAVDELLEEHPWLTAAAAVRLVGRLADFGSGAGLGRRFRGAAALDRLHWNLRAHCYVRRTKADVLPQLPAKRFASVPVELDNVTEYRLAEADVIAWLRTQPLDLRTLEARVAAALRAEQLARLNYLRRLAARGKLGAAIAWIEDFTASGEPLVVFAHHREVQRALLEPFPAAAHVLGDDDLAARAAAVDDFQRPDGSALTSARCRRPRRASLSSAPPTSRSSSLTGRRQGTTRRRTAVTASASTTP